MSRATRAVSLLGLVVALAACKPATSEHASVVTEPQVPAVQSDVATPPAVADAMPASAQLKSLGDLRIGATFGNAPGDKAFVSAGMRELMEGDCEYYDKGTLPEGMSMMVLGNRIARFELHIDGDPSIAIEAPATDAPVLPYGLWVGMSALEAKKRLPAGVVVSPHAYSSPDGDYLTWTDKADGLAIRLETLNGRVTSIYWGLPDAVELIEGCA